MMNSFFTKLAMLILFMLAVTTAWAAVSMTFPASLFNILLGILAAFFLFRALELVDKVNKYGQYYEDPNDKKQEPPQSRPRTRAPNGENVEDPGIPDEE